MLKLKITGKLVEKEGIVSVNSDLEFDGYATKGELVGVGAILADAIANILPKLTKTEAFYLCKSVNKAFEEYAKK